MTTLSSMALEIVPVQNTLPVTPKCESGVAVGSRIDIFRRSAQDINGLKGCLFSPVAMDVRFNIRDLGVTHTYCDSDKNKKIRCPCNSVDDKHRWNKR